MSWKEQMTAGVIADIQRERERQKEIEGWTPEHDDTHRDGEMAVAAAAYAYNAAQGDGSRKYNEDHPITIWPWDQKRWKPKTRRRDLIKAAALIVAEIERLDRAALERDGPKMASREVSR